MLLFTNTAEAKKLKNKDPITIDSVLKELNATRTTLKLKPVLESKKLNKIAEKRIDDMIKYKYFAHNNPTTGKKAWQVLDDNKVAYKYTGEILAKDFTKTKDLITAWTNSPTHYSAITNSKYNQVGISVKKNMVVVVFVLNY